MFPYLVRSAKSILSAVFIEHPNAILHIWLSSITSLLIFLVLFTFQRDFGKRAEKKIKREAKIQKTLDDINKKINELGLSGDLNHECVTEKLFLMHERVKDIYIDLLPKRPMRAPRNDKESNFEKFIVRSAIEMMKNTDFKNNE